MDVLGWVILVVGALVIGWILASVGGGEIGYRWLISAVGAAAGGFIGSESLGGASTWGPELGGMFVLPALIGAVLVAAVVEWVQRQVTHAGPTGQPIR